MKNARSILMVISSLTILAFLVIFDYSDIKARPNLGYLLGMIASAGNITVLILSIRHERKQR